MQDLTTEDTMKKDIFNGKIKKEYFSYILVYMIFFLLLFCGIGAFLIFVSMREMSANAYGERLAVAIFGGLAILAGFVFLFLELLVIRRYPKYEKLRHSTFNSDCYFTDSTSYEYHGDPRYRFRAGFNMVTLVAESEKRMGEKRPVKYKVYSALTYMMLILGGVSFVGMVILLKNQSKLPEALQDDTTLCLIFLLVLLACTVLAVFFFYRALNVATNAPFGDFERRHELYSSLKDLSVRRNNRKLKFWYNPEQLSEIETLVQSASFNAELKLIRKGGRLVSFEVVDLHNDRTIFTGRFI